MDAGAHIVVKGLVQGVGFRYFVATRASHLGLTGYVRNLWSGDVEIEAEGDRSGIEELLSEVKVGPRSAQVSDLRIEWHEQTNKFTRFEIR